MDRFTGMDPKIAAGGVAAGTLAAFAAHKLRNGDDKIPEKLIEQLESREITPNTMNWSAQSRSRRSHFKVNDYAQKISKALSNWRDDEE